MVVSWSDLAYESLYDIVAYIQGFFGKRVAIDASNQIESFVDTLVNAPFIGKCVSKRNGCEIRCVIYKKNQIYYSICKDTIDIILIWDGRQDPRRLKQLIDNYLQLHA